MNTMKTILFLSLAINLVLGWMLWRNQRQLHTPRQMIADDQRETRVLTPGPLHYSYSSNDEAPKVEAPDGIKATVEPAESSPFANAGLQVRRVSPFGAARFEMRDVKNLTAPEDSVEFNDYSPRIRSDWQTPPRLNLKPGGRSTPFSTPDWDDHPPLNRILDGRPIPKPRGGP